MRSLNKPDNAMPVSSVTDFKDVKQYLKDHPDQKKDLHKGALGSVSLQDLKGHFESEKLRFDDIQKAALRKKEQEMADEL